MPSKFFESKKAHEVKQCMQLLSTVLFCLHGNVCASQYKVTSTDRHGQSYISNRYICD